ncbi:MAG: ADOP family duplicated permease [Vicinamibacterales bacterium]|jgi:predicted permease
MPLLPRLRSLWRNLVHRDAIERDLDDELGAALGLLIDEKIAAGLPEWEARRAAMIELGGIEPIKERVRDERGGRFIESLSQDVRYGWRHIRRAPGFSAAAILTLAFGIGVNTAMFSVLDTLLIQRLPIPDPDALFSLSSYNERGDKRYIPMPTAIELNREGPFQAACGYNGGGIVAAQAGGVPVQAVVAFVTGRCFDAFGVMPSLGRQLVDADAPIMSRGRMVVVISDRLWRLAFNRDHGVLGKPLRVEAAEVTVVGVMPQGFRGIHVDTGIDIFAPPDTIIPALPGRRPVAQEVLGRLKPGVTHEQASAQLNTMWPGLLQAARDATREANEGSNLLGATVRLESMGRGLSTARDNYARPVRLIFGLTALLLVLACINLGGLLLTRLSARSTELGVRLALGGSHGRIAQQMLVESLLLAFGGTLLAVPLAFALVAPVSVLLNPGYAGWELSFAPNLRVLLVTAGAGLLVGLLLTALPTWFAMRRHASVRFAWDRTVTGATSRWTRGLLVAQVALSVILLVGASLLAQSLYAIQHADPGVRTAGMLNARLMSSPGGLRGLDAESHYPALVEKLTAIPGVAAVGFARAFPRRLSNVASDVGFVGEQFTGIRTALDNVSSNFFDLVGMRLLAGRPFTAADTRKSRRVAIVSDSLARALTADGDVVDRRVRFGTLRDMQDILIVGVVSNATLGDLKNTAPHVIYSPAFQSASFNGPNLIFATSGDTGPIAAAVRRIVLQHGREYAFDIATLDELFARAPARERMSAAIASMVGGLAVLLSVLGVHGVLAYSVARRRREIGIRLAIGAVPAQVANAVMREGLVLTVIGVGVGIPSAYVAARAMQSLLFGISAGDALTFGTVTILFGVLGTLAGIMPARKAASVDPAIALRAD